MIKAAFIGARKIFLTPNVVDAVTMFFGHLFFYDKKLFQQAHELPGQKLRSNSKTKPGFAAKRGLLPDGHTVEVCFFKV